MHEIKYALTPEDVEWEMDWSQVKSDGTRMYPDHPETEMVFEIEKAVAHLIINDVIFLNSHHWEKEWAEKARKSTALLVNCNDLFAWGCADAEEISTEDKEVETLYRMWKQNPVWGPSLWCMVKRREMPQNPVAKAMRDIGIDLDEFRKEHNLRVNFYDGFGQALHKAGLKYDSPDYAAFRAAWIKDNGWEGDAE